MAEPSAGRRGVSPPWQGTDGYYQNWYPIGFAREVGVGQVVAKDFLDGRVAALRLPPPPRRGRGLHPLTSARSQALARPLAVGGWSSPNTGLEKKAGFPL